MSRVLKDSGIQWIGMIPEDWTFGRVKNKFVFHKNIAGTDSEKYDRISLTLNGVIKRDKEDTNGLQPESFEGYQIVYKDDMIFKLIDLQNVSTSRVGKSGYTGITSPAYIILSDLDNTRFSLYYFLNLWYQEVFNNIGGDGVRSAINKDDLLNIPYPILSISEQQRIADYLDKKCRKIDEQKANYEKSIELLKEYKQSLIIEVVTRGLNQNAEMKDSGIEWIGKIPTGWGINIIFQFFIQVKNRNTGLQENNLLSLSYGKIKRKDIETAEGLLPESFDGYNIIEADDIVLRLTDLQNDHKSLRVGMATERGIITSAYVTIRNISNSKTKYLYYFLHSFDLAKGFYGMGGGVRQGLNWDELKWIRILTPPLSEQEEIVNYLDRECGKIDKVIAYREQMIEKLEEYKKSLIYEYVTGKKEIK